MDKAQRYWKDHQLWRFVQFDIRYNERTDKDELMNYEARYLTIKIKYYEISN